mgnify:CR=1 FL=1
MLFPLCGTPSAGHAQRTQLNTMLLSSFDQSDAFTQDDGPEEGAAVEEFDGVELTGFVRLEVGEGIVVEKEDFAAEVAKAVQG